MNARERLRAYLEQRRELGESEMLLDALDVDDVMRMLGALQGGGSAPAESSAAPPSTTRPLTAAGTARVEVPPAAPAPSRDEPRATPMADRDTGGGAGSTPNADWRQMMQDLRGNGPIRPLPGVPVPPPAAAPAPDDASAPAAARKPGTLRVDGVVFPLGLRVERPVLLSGAAAGAEWQSLEQVNAAIAGCKACPLVETATQPVPGVGNPFADVLVVGEAPGEKEDLTGEPFVGPAGELLNKILGAIQLDRETVYICNVLKHRPPGNRNPMPDEVRACAPFLQRQVDLVQPKIILAFGAFAAQSLLGTKLAIGKLRQQLHWYQGIPLVATYHPAALLRNEAWKRPTWEDIKLARRILDATIRA